LFLIAFLSAMLIFLMNAGLIDLITPAFLVAYGLLLYLLRDHYRKKRFILSGLAIALGGLCYFIPAYWSSAFSILGIAHMAYGITTIN
jgi:membrane protein CcdC involved in cytochrome C biogenesis